MPTHQPTVLIVDDSPADLALLLEILDREGYQTTTASDGVEAWALLERDPDSIDIVLLDRLMPRMGGMELLQKIKEQPSTSMLPVIMQTGANAREEMLEGIRAGAYYYVSKPYDRDVLLSIVASASSDIARYKELQSDVRQRFRGLALLREGRFECRTLEEAHDLGVTLANASPDPARTVIGLTELLVNAVEHGNLGITYEEKSQLTAHGDCIDEIARRLALPENATKNVDVRFERSETEVRFTITDRGPGFESQRYMSIDPQRAFHSHGRGIAMANLLSFSRLEYIGCGNQVIGTIRL